MLTVKITDEMKSEARRRSNIITANFKTGGNYTHLESPDAYYFGFLGELVFCELLLEKNATYYTSDIPEAQGYDFTLNTLMGEKTVDVKTCTKSFHKRIMMPKAQSERYKYDYYVGVKINNDIGEVWGYCKPGDFEFSERGFDPLHPVPTLYRNLADLYTVEELLEITTDGELTVNETIRKNR